MEHTDRKSIHDDLCKYDHLQDKDSFIEVTEWSNGAGIDVSLNEKLVQLTYGELEAINCLKMNLEYNNE